jgi:hypothetical protein
MPIGHERNNARIDDPQPLHALHLKVRPDDVFAEGRVGAPEAGGGDPMGACT